MIFHGKKKFEFRKHGFKKPIEKAFIYATKPVGKIVGYFTFAEVLRGTPTEIWEICSEDAGVSKDNFDKYFEKAKTAFAIKINNVSKFEDPISPPTIFKKFKAPRSFVYLDNNIISLIGH